MKKVMTVELLFNLLFLVFFIICFGMTFSLGAGSGSRTDPMGSALWPQIILVLLIICLGWNIYKIIKKNKQTPEEAEKLTFATIKGFFTSKMFVGILISAGMAILMEPLGFLPTTALFIAAYAVLLGERKWWKVLLISLAVTVILYLIFFLGLSIWLPRGMGPMRNFSLGIETMLLNLQRAIKGLF